jgi:hypothetical protein
MELIFFEQVEESTTDRRLLKNCAADSTVHVSQCIGTVHNQANWPKNKWLFGTSVTWFINCRGEKYE